MAKITANGKVFSSPLTVIYKTPKGWTLELSFYPDGGDVDAHIYNKRKTTDETITAVDLDDYEDDEVAEVTSSDFLYSAIDAFSVDNPKIPAYDEWTLERIKPTNGFSSESKNETKFDPSQYDFFKASYTLDGTNRVKNTNGIVDAQGTLEMAQRHGATNLNLVGVKDGTETDIPLSDVGISESKDEAMSLKGFLETLEEKLVKQFDLDEDEVKSYLDAHTQEMQELLDDKEMSLKEKVLFVRGEITGEKDEAKEPTEEKLGYEKGHKNSKGEDAPWVIRSHEDNRILASFAKKTDAEEHLQRMKQYSKKESRTHEALETYACFIDFGNEADAKKGMEIVKGWKPVIDGTAVVVSGISEQAANRLWGDWKKKCSKAGLAVSDEGEVYKEDPSNNYNGESKKSENAATEEDAIRKAFKSIVNHVPANEKSNFDEEFVTDNMEALLDLFNAWFVFDDGEFVTTVRVVDPDNENGDCYDADDEAYQWNACYNVTEGIIDLLGWNYGEETVKQPIQDALFYDFIGTKYIDDSNESKKRKKSEKLFNKAELERYAKKHGMANERAIPVAKDLKQKISDGITQCLAAIKEAGAVANPIAVANNGERPALSTRDTLAYAPSYVYRESGMERNYVGVMFHVEKGDDYGQLFIGWDKKNNRPFVWAGGATFDSYDAFCNDFKRDFSECFKKSEASDLAGYTSDVISELVVTWACGEDGAKRLADKYSDTIQQNYADGDLLASETAKFIAEQENLTESCKKQESRKSEVRLELIDTIVVPKWLWEAYNFGNEYGEDLDEHEQNILSEFKEKYADCHLDDEDEEAYFSSYNDFDSYGGQCYTVKVYKEK